MWKPMTQFPYPSTEWDINYKEYLFYDKQLGFNIGYCMLIDIERKTYGFYMKGGRDSLALDQVICWMELLEISEFITELYKT